MTITRPLLALYLAIVCLWLPVGASAQSASASSSTDSSSASGAAFTIPTEMVQRYIKARWTYPGAVQMADLYPERAANQEKSGTAKIACLIGPDGYLDRCAVMEETPKDYGFGVATATAFVKFAHVDPASVEGGVKPGDVKVFIYHWQLG